MRKTTYLLVIAFMFSSSILLIGQSDEEIAIKLLTTKTQFEAGLGINLQFSTSNNSQPILYCSNSYGTILIEPSIENKTLNYKIPENIANRSGLVNWKLLADDNTLSGKFYINPKQAANTMETYIGPPSIEAGGLDYTMLVVIPTDIYGNALKDSTEVEVKHQFLSSEYRNMVRMHNLIAYKNLYSETKTGRMLVSSETLGKNSKEYVIDVQPAIPTNFNISFKQNHNYADGNQITTLLSSIIRDKNGNIVSDGTLVDFFITNSDKNILRTSAPTINGIAMAKTVHPDYEDIWNIKAYIEGMAESDIITINFEQIIKGYDVVFSNNNRTITVGPLQSFMGQMIPDGLQIKLHIYKDDTKIDMILKESFEGFTTFKLNPNEIPSDSYNMMIEVAKIEKTFKHVKL
ncbi:hypothetical protein Q4Q35_04590 [Flavivirga aquimarina]|uniref:Uncharacterized protein n=1 Tax=Flavivirga aquimarina TaxID=2027862 RepID=A0ABT8W7J1_9FLAO|nr:hypothetical protein [Flavivirga aquimarina]MDO5969078.1 hypothetical protein [Flavivirga aquimarina]